jgi:hypothetical protein
MSALAIPNGQGCRQTRSNSDVRLVGWQPESRPAIASDQAATGMSASRMQQAFGATVMGAQRPALDFGKPTVIATSRHYPKIGFARKPSSPLACSSSTIARPTAIMSATAASIF